MITTTYKCDRCGHEQNTNDQMWTIKVFIDHHGHDSQWSFNKINVLWCRACVDEVGFLGKPSTPNVQEATRGTLEDSFREIVREEIANSQG